MRVMIMYEHCSPHQVTAIEAARSHFAQAGHRLIPLECYSGSAGYGWTFADKARPDGWQCLFPGKEHVTPYRIVWGVLRAAMNQRVHVLVLNGWYGIYTWLLVFLKKVMNCKIVLVSDTPKWNRQRRASREFPKRLLLRSVDAGFVAGTPQGEYLRNLGLASSRMRMGNDVVDNSLYTDIPIRTQPKDRTIVIGTATRLIPEKNLHMAITAFAQVAKEHPQLQLIWRIVGRGPLEEELRTLAHSLKAPVKFLGFRPYHEMPDFYKNLDLYWQPSLHETWGLAINEAMAAGLPVVVSRHCGCSVDLVKPDNGWIQDITSVESIRSSWQTILADSQSWPHKGESSRKLIQDWGLPRFAQGLLETCLAARHARRASPGQSQLNTNST